MTASPVATVVAPGSSRHGVVAHARRSACDTGSIFVELPAGPAAAPAARLGIDRESTDVLHVHYTDQLFGRRCEEGPAVAADLVAHVGRPTVFTLHDVPGADGDARDARRIDAYRRVAALADRLIVASTDEAARLAAVGVGRPVDVVPMPWEPVAPSDDVDRDGSMPVVGVLGFVFPGKGHHEVLRAAAMIGSVAVRAIGAISDGHDDLARSLDDDAARLGVPFAVTGFVMPAHLPPLLASVDVPVVAVRHSAASASLLTWIGAHRRPLARATPYTREIDRWAPGAIHLYDGDDPTGMTRAIEGSLRDPCSTRAATRPAALSPERIADRTSEIYRRLAGTRS